MWPATTFFVPQVKKKTCLKQPPQTFDQQRNEKSNISQIIFILLQPHSCLLAPMAPIGNSKFEILLVKVFTLKQKANQIPLATIEKK